MLHYLAGALDAVPMMIKGFSPALIVVKLYAFSSVIIYDFGPMRGTTQKPYMSTIVGLAVDCVMVAPLFVGIFAVYDVS